MTRHPRDSDQRSVSLGCLVDRRPYARRARGRVQPGTPGYERGKYRLLAQHCAYERVLLFHVYTLAFNSYGSRKALGNFYAGNMQVELSFEYVQFDRCLATDSDEVSEEVSSAIRPHLIEAFGAQ
jgi:hypothetical protein